jgi:TldD protein
VTPGSWDLILEPTNLWLTIHESIGHPTELDRAMGYEANYAGTSFIAPPDRHIGKLRYGRELMNVRADRTQAQSLARCAWDDEGVPSDEWLLVEKGLFKDYQTTREQVAWIAKLTSVTRSHGCAFADSWGSVTFQRMPNVSLLPGEQEIGLDEIVAATERGMWSGIAARGRSITSGTTSSSRARCFMRCAAARSLACSRTSPTRRERRSSGTAWT